MPRFSGIDAAGRPDALGKVGWSGDVPSWLTPEAAVAGFVGEPAPHRALTGYAAARRWICDFFWDSRPAVGGGLSEIFCIASHWAPEVPSLRFRVRVTALRPSRHA
jgi:hypothetical protein